MTVLSAWLILAYFRERLILGKSTVTQHGILREKTIAVDELSHVTWRRIPNGGSLVVRTLADKLTIYLNNFTAKEREAITRFFHESVDPDRQEGWSRFEASLTQRPSKASGPSRTGIVATGLVLLAFAGIFLYCWSRGLGTQYLIIGWLNAAVALWYFRRLKSLPNRRGT
jgi:hypothetical protein